MTGKHRRILKNKTISLVGTGITKKLIQRLYCQIMGRDPKELPSFIIPWLPVRLTYNNNYFNDLYQGIPVGGIRKS